MGSIDTIAGNGAIYLDTNILIYAVEDASGFGARLRPVFDRIDRGEMVAVTSELALAEILVKPLRDGNLVARQEFEAMLVPGGPLKLNLSASPP